MSALRLCCGLFGFLGIASAQTFFPVVSIERGPVRLGEYCLVVEDQAHNLTPETLLSQKALDLFQPSSHDILNFGFTSSTYWIRLGLRNESADSLFVLGVNNPLLDELVFYVEEGGMPRALPAGLVAGKSRKGTRTPSIELHLDTNDSITILCRVRSSTAVVIPIVFWTAEEFFQNSRDEILILGMYYGILLVLVAYNILLFLSMKEVIYLEYSALVLCYALSQFTFDGLLSVYLPQVSPWITGHIFPVTYALMIVLAHSLTQSLLGTTVHAPGHHRIMNAVMAAGLGWVGAVVVLPLSVTYPVTPVLTTAAILFLLVPAYARWKEGYQPARPFAIAIMALSVALLVRMFRHVGVLTDIALTVHPVHLGSLVDAALLSIALSDRINLRKIEDEVGKMRLRDRLARDLHDDLASTLGSISLFASSLSSRLKRPAKEVNQLLERITRLALDSVDAIGDIVWSVSPERDSLGQLFIRMKDFSSQICTAHNIRYDLHMEASSEDLLLDPDARRQVYLIFKEAVNNAVRHSKADLLTVKSRMEGRMLHLQISDNGRGFRPREHGERGHGLRSMRKRAEEIGATLRIESSSQGTSVRLMARMT